MKNNKNVILGIMLIIWGVVFFAHNVFFVKILYDNIVLQGTNLSLYLAKFDSIANIMDIFFFIVLILLTLISIIYYVKNKESFSSKDFIIAIAATFVFHILGFKGISWFFSIISGILLIAKKKKVNN